MPRTARLLELLQNLRRRKYAAQGRTLAAELGVSLRTLYRDIATLQAEGVPIEGEAGVGYVLRPGYVLPPLMFTRDEIEAMVLGAQWVAERGDDRLRADAHNALAKIRAVVPSSVRREMEWCTLLVPLKESARVDSRLVAAVRRAIRADAKLEISYRDPTNVVTRRTIWPFAIAFFDEAQIVLAWCEMRKGFRHFRVDRVESLVSTCVTYQRPHQELLREWRASEKIPVHGIEL